MVTHEAAPVRGIYNDMKPPIEGMKTIPLYADNDLLMGAYIACVRHSIMDNKMREYFKDETGINLDSLINCSPLDQMIDEQTGRTNEYFIAFCDWVTKNVWGEEE